MVRLATRDSISSSKEDTSTGRCTGERPGSHRYAAFLEQLRRHLWAVQGGLRRLRRLCFRNPFSQSQNFSKVSHFCFFSFQRFSIFDFKKIILSSRSTAPRDIASTTSHTDLRRRYLSVADGLSFRSRRTARWTTNLTLSANHRPSLIPASESGAKFFTAGLASHTLTGRSAWATCLQRSASCHHAFRGSARPMFTIALGDPFHKSPEKTDDALEPWRGSNRVFRNAAREDDDIDLRPGGSFSPHPHPTPGLFEGRSRISRPI
jgi:hypothetical protein